MIDDSDGRDNLDEVVKVDLIAMAPVKLECPNAECTLGASGAMYKTTEVEIQYAPFTAESRAMSGRCRRPK